MRKKREWLSLFSNVNPKKLKQNAHILSEYDVYRLARSYK